MRKPPPDLAHRVPPGQVLTEKWPVLTYGQTPRFDPKKWSFRCFGLVEAEVDLVLGRVPGPAARGGALRHPLRDPLVAPRQPLRGRAHRGDHAAGAREPEARFVRIHADPDYTTNLPLDRPGGRRRAPRPQARWRRTSTPDHGGPLRLVVPKLYFWKSAKWLRAFEFLDVNAPGFWELNGYHMHADPWKEERYSDQETDAMQRMRAEAARKLRGR